MVSIDRALRNVRENKISRAWLLFCVLVTALWARTASGQAQPGFSFAGTTTVGATSSPISVTLTAQSSGTITGATALTAGQARLDFAISDQGTCANNTALSPGQTCQVQVTFSPGLPGIRLGAVVLQSGAGTLASTAISGLALGSLPVLLPGEINTVAGDGDLLYRQDNVPATQAPIFLPVGLAVDAAGDLFLCDSGNNRVREVSASTGNITTVAGNGESGSSGDGQLATLAELNRPSGLVLDGAGNLYIADTGNNTVRHVDLVSGIITTVAGTAGVAAFSDGAATSATKLSGPVGLALTPMGNVVIADTGNSAVRLLNLASGQVSTIAGTGQPGFSGDGAAAAQAQLNSPYGVAVSAQGLAIADTANQRIRFVDLSGNISTIVGDGQRNYSGENVPALQAELDEPVAVAFDPAGDLYIADSENNRVRAVFGSPGMIQTVAGKGDEGFAGDGGPDSQAVLYKPYALVFDPSGNLWISDMSNNRVREVYGSLFSISYPTMKVGKTSSPYPGGLYNAGNADLVLNAPVLNQAALDPATTTCNQSSMAPMSSCTMGVEFAPTQVGSNVTGSILWNSNAPNVTPRDALNGQVLSVEPTTTALSSSMNPGLLGQPVTLTATITSATATFTGTVTFTEGSTNWCSNVAVTSTGSGTVAASCTIPSLSLGTHAFTAKYSGDTNDAASVSPEFDEVIKQQAALALGVSSSPAVVTSNVTLTLKAQDQSGVPTGSVVFYDGGAALATVPLNSSGVATWSTQNFSIGTHSLSAQYSGDNANAPETSNVVSEQITQASTVTVISSSNSTPTVGQAVLFTANVVSNNGPAPTGSVQFTDGTGASATVLATATLDSNGTASASIASLSPGGHTIFASYQGDTDDAVSTSTGLQEQVQQIATTTTLSADADPINAGATLHLTAIVSMAPQAMAQGALTGVVTFVDGQSVLGSAPINSTGQATLAVNGLSVGTHPITANFSGATNYADSSSAVLKEVVQQTATQAVLTTASATTLAGKPVLFTATVVSSTGVPTGTATFHDGSALLGSVALNSAGIAILTSTGLTVGTHTVTVTYGGDINYQASTSTFLTQTVVQAQPVLQLSGPASAVDAGTNAQFAAVLSSNGVAPTGVLSLREGSSVLAVVQVANNGSFTFNTAQLTVGTHSVVATYGGDAFNAAVTSAPISVVIKQATTVTALQASVNPLTQGAPLTLVASVTSDSPDISGSVTLMDGSVVIATEALGSTASVSFQPGGLALGVHNLTAVYGGDVHHLASTSPAVPELVVQGTTATLTTNVNPAASGQAIRLVAQISGTAQASGQEPTGTVVFQDSGVSIGSVPLAANGSAVFVTSALAVGTHSLTITYGGDQHFAAAGAQLRQAVIEASTTMNLQVGANPATYAQPLSFTATIGSNGGVASGSVSFLLDGATSIGSAALNANGIAVLSLSTLSPGNHTVTAVYAGDGKAEAVTSAPVAFGVKQTTALALSADANPALTLSPVALTATLTSAQAVAASGSIVFREGTTELGSATLNSTGHATLTLPQLTAGTHLFTAAYAGDTADFASDAAPYTESVQLRSTTTSVTGSATDPANPQQMTLIAVVRGDGSVPPSGLVTFTSGDLTLGAAAVDATGVADITVIFSSTQVPVIATYAGDASYKSSQSPSTTVTAGQPAQFTLNLNAPNITLVTHQHTTVTITLGSVKGFTDTVALGCLGLPYAATCTFTHPKLALAADSNASTTLIVDTGNPLGAGTGTSASIHGRGGSVWFCWLPAGLLFGLLPRKRLKYLRKHLGVLLTLACAVALSISLSGCSGLSTSGTPPGTYTFKVVGTGQGSGTTQTQTVTLVVTQ